MRKSNLVDHAGLRVDLEVLVKLSAPRLLIFSHNQNTHYRKKAFTDGSSTVVLKEHGWIE